MSCNNCFNGCVQTTSDKCVKYTGDSIAALGIATGDPLYSVIDKITDYLLTALDGTGIIPTIEPSYICTLIGDYLPATPTAVDLLTAIIRAICSLKTTVDGVVADVATIEAAYTTSCLAGSLTGTHDVLQAVITEVCSMATDITTLAANFINYVLISDVDTYIAAYLASISASTKYYTKMVPYTVVEYYGDLTGKFDLTGAGYGDWEKIFLCNGQNGTPDKRGRIPVGATTMGATAFNSAVDPAIPGNPTYALNTTYGANTVAISEAQLPAHTHTATSTVTDGEHSHFSVKSGGSQIPITNLTPIKDESLYGDTTSYDLSGVVGAADVGLTSSSSSNISVSTANANTGSGDAHSNIPPVHACYYLMYKP